MNRKTDTSTLSEEANRALKEIEERIAQLDTKWKLFFLGSRDQRCPPEKETEELARDIRNLPMRYIFRARHQFMHSNLSYRYHSLRERWNRFMRILEERGRTAVLDAMGIHNPNIRARVAKAGGPGYRPPPQPARKDPYDRLFQEFVQALQKTGSNAKLDPERFKKELKRQEQAIRKKVGDKPLEFSVTIENGRPKVKVKVKKKGKRT